LRFFFNSNERINLILFLLNIILSAKINYSRQIYKDIFKKCYICNKIVLYIFIAHEK